MTIAQVFLKLVKNVSSELPCTGERIGTRCMHRFWVAEYNIVFTSCTVLCSEQWASCKEVFPHQFHQQFRIIFFTEHALNMIPQLDNTFTLEIRLSNRNYVFSEKDLPTIYFCTDKENYLNSVSPPVPIMCFAHCTVHCTVHCTS